MSVPVSTQTAPAHAVAAVTPVVDYEPPMLDAPPRGPASRGPNARQASSTARSPMPATLRAVPATPRPALSGPSDQLRTAGAFTDAALRRVLEVIDRRRPVTQLRPLMAGGLTDSVLALHRLIPASGDAAVLRRVRLQPADKEDTTVEVSATYTRGDRVHAIACRVQRLPGPTGARWQIVALHIG